MQGNIYCDQREHAFVHKLWTKEHQLFELEETQRLSRLNKELEDNPPFNGLILLLYLCLTVGSIVIGCSYGAGAGWGLWLVGMIPCGALLSGAQKLGRWQARNQLIRRSYPVPEPMYEPQPSQEERAQHTKKERWEQEERASEYQERQRGQQTHTGPVIKITSLRRCDQDHPLQSTIELDTTIDLKSAGEFKADILARQKAIPFRPFTIRTKPDCANGRTFNVIHPSCLWFTSEAYIGAQDPIRPSPHEFPLEAIAHIRP
jgi:hypothetical protein